MALALLLTFIGGLLLVPLFWAAVFIVVASVSIGTGVQQIGQALTANRRQLGARAAGIETTGAVGAMGAPVTIRVVDAVGVCPLRTARERHVHGQCHWPSDPASVPPGVGFSGARSRSCSAVRTPCHGAMPLPAAGPLAPLQRCACHAYGGLAVPSSRCRALKEAASAAIRVLIEVDSGGRRRT